MLLVSTKTCVCILSTKTCVCILSTKTCVCICKADILMLLSADQS